VDVGVETLTRHYFFAMQRPAALHLAGLGHLEQGLNTGAFFISSYPCVSWTCRTTFWGKLLLKAAPLTGGGGQQRSQLTRGRVAGGYAQSSSPSTFVAAFAPRSSGKSSLPASKRR
jgi:hypothetical protein